MRVSLSVAAALALSCCCVLLCSLTYGHNTRSRALSRRLARLPVAACYCVCSPTFVRSLPTIDCLPRSPVAAAAANTTSRQSVPDTLCSRCDVSALDVFLSVEAAAAASSRCVISRRVSYRMKIILEMQKNY